MKLSQGTKSTGGFGKNSMERKQLWTGDLVVMAVDFLVRTLHLAMPLGAKQLVWIRCLEDFDCPETHQADHRHIAITRHGGWI